MASTLTATPRKLQSGAPDADRYGRRRAELLEHATGVFCEKGYAGASMRDLSRATGMSLAGMYHYFQSKERVLYLIQKHAFETILARLEAALATVEDPERRVRGFILNHLEYFIANQAAMKVLAHEDSVLQGELGEEIRTVKRRYYQACYTLIDELKQQRQARGVPTRLAVLSLFGMMNWLYTWRRPRLDANAAELARGMADLFLGGLLGGAAPGERPSAGYEKSAARRRRQRSSKV
jgi:AcrR family transcriptional regulator